VCLGREDAKEVKEVKEVGAAEENKEKAKCEPDRGVTLGGSLNPSLPPLLRSPQLPP
jgi:hypothetical protein